TPRFNELSGSETCRTVPDWMFASQICDSAENGSDSPVVNDTCRFVTHLGAPSTHMSETCCTSPVSTSSTNRLPPGKALPSTGSSPGSTCSRPAQLPASPGAYVEH